MWNDATLNIDWGVTQTILSAKDSVLGCLDELLKKM